LPALALAFYIAFIPHQGYPYPVHIDDWIHLANSEAILKAGSLTYPEPFFGEATVSLSSNLELGFQLFWGIFQRISGISWLTIYRYFPAVIFIITIVSAYILANRQGFGWEAAFFVALIPTTVGILGPAFLVPVAMGLLFIPLALFVALNFRGPWAYVVLFIFTCFLVAIHAPSAICLVIILVPYMLLNLKGNFRHSLFLFLAVIVPFLAPFPWIFDRLLPTAQALFNPQALPEYVDFPHIIRSYGYLTVGLCLLGTLVLAVKGGKRNHGLVLGLLLLLVMLVAFFTFHYGVSIVYERGLMFMMLMIGIVAGAGLMAVKDLRLPRWLDLGAKAASVTRYTGWCLCLVLVGVTLFFTIPDRQDIPYYHMIDDEDYATFVWIKENVSEPYDRAVLDPWQGVPFAAVTGKYVYARIHTFATDTDLEARRFLEGGCADTAFLRENSISIVYTRQECSNPDLTEVHRWVYLLEAP
jgi:hypothetical protein